MDPRIKETVLPPLRHREHLNNITKGFCEKLEQATAKHNSLNVEPSADSIALMLEIASDLTVYMNSEAYLVVDREILEKLTNLSLKALYTLNPGEQLGDLFLTVVLWVLRAVPDMHFDDIDWDAVFRMYEYHYNFYTKDNKRRSYNLFMANYLDMLSLLRFRIPVEYEAKLISKLKYLLCPVDIKATTACSLLSMFLPCVFTDVKPTPDPHGFIGYDRPSRMSNYIIDQNIASVTAAPHRINTDITELPSNGIEIIMDFCSLKSDYYGDMCFMADWYGFPVLMCNPNVRCTHFDRVVDLILDILLENWHFLPHIFMVLPDCLNDFVYEYFESSKIILFVNLALNRHNFDDLIKKYHNALLFIANNSAPGANETDLFYNLAQRFLQGYKILIDVNKQRNEKMKLTDDQLQFMLNGMTEALFYVIIGRPNHRLNYYYLVEEKMASRFDHLALQTLREPDRVGKKLALIQIQTMNLKKYFTDRKFPDYFLRLTILALDMFTANVPEMALPIIIQYVGMFFSLISPDIEPEDDFDFTVQRYLEEIGYKFVDVLFDCLRTKVSSSGMTRSLKETIIFAIYEFNRVYAAFEEMSSLGAIFIHYIDRVKDTIQSVMINSKTSIIYARALSICPHLVQKQSMKIIRRMTETNVNNVMLNSALNYLQMGIFNTPIKLHYYYELVPLLLEFVTNGVSPETLETIFFTVQCLLVSLMTCRYEQGVNPNSKFAAYETHSYKDFEFEMKCPSQEDIELISSEMTVVRDLYYSELEAGNYTAASVLFHMLTPFIRFCPEKNYPLPYGQIFSYDLVTDGILPSSDAVFDDLAAMLNDAMNTSMPLKLISSCIEALSFRYIIFYPCAGQVILKMDGVIENQYRALFLDHGLDETDIFVSACFAATYLRNLPQYHPDMQLLYIPKSILWLLANEHSSIRQAAGELIQHFFTRCNDHPLFFKPYFNMINDLLIKNPESMPMVASLTHELTEYVYSNVFVDRESIIRILDPVIIADVLDKCKDLPIPSSYSYEFYYLQIIRSVTWFLYERPSNDCDERRDAIHYMLDNLHLIKNTDIKIEMLFAIVSFSHYGLYSLFIANDKKKYQRALYSDGVYRKLFKIIIELYEENAKFAILSKLTDLFNNILVYFRIPKTKIKLTDFESNHDHWLNLTQSFSLDDWNETMFIDKNPYAWSSKHSLPEDFAVKKSIYVRDDVKCPIFVEFTQFFSEILLKNDAISSITNALVESEGTNVMITSRIACLSNLEVCSKFIDAAKNMLNETAESTRAKRHLVACTIAASLCRSCKHMDVERVKFIYAGAIEIFQRIVADGTLHKFETLYSSVMCMTADREIRRLKPILDLGFSMLEHSIKTNTTRTTQMSLMFIRAVSTESVWKGVPYVAERIMPHMKILLSSPFANIRSECVLLLADLIRSCATATFDEHGKLIRGQIIFYDKFVDHLCQVFMEFLKDAFDPEHFQPIIRDLAQYEMRPCEEALKTVPEFLTHFHQKEVILFPSKFLNVLLYCHVMCASHSLPFFANKSVGSWCYYVTQKLSMTEMQELLAYIMGDYDEKFLPNVRRTANSNFFMLKILLTLFVNKPIKFRDMFIEPIVKLLVEECSTKLWALFSEIVTKLPVFGDPVFLEFMDKLIERVGMDDVDQVNKKFCANGISAVLNYESYVIFDYMKHLLFTLPSLPRTKKVEKMVTNFKKIHKDIYDDFFEELTNEQQEILLDFEPYTHYLI
ncbi:hypothetical protein PCE1_001202 [Barthelona sp. PCE]